MSKFDTSNSVLAVNDDQLFMMYAEHLYMQCRLIVYIHLAASAPNQHHLTNAAVLLLQLYCCCCGCWCCHRATEVNYSIAIELVLIFTALELCLHAAVEFHVRMSMGPCIGDVGFNHMRHLSPTYYDRSFHFIIAKLLRE